MRHIFKLHLSHPLVDGLPEDEKEQVLNAVKSFKKDGHIDKRLIVKFEDDDTGMIISWDGHLRPEYFIPIYEWVLTILTEFTNIRLDECEVLHNQFRKI